LILIKHSKLVW